MNALLRQQLVGLIVAATVLAPVPASAQSEPAQAAAERLVVEGKRHLELDRYDDAIASFEEAYRQVPTPLLHFYIAVAYREKHDCGAARTAFNRYLRTQDNEFRTKAEQRVAAIDAGTDEKCVPGKVVDVIVPPPPVGDGAVGTTTSSPGTGTATAPDTGATTEPDTGTTTTTELVIPTPRGPEPIDAPRARPGRGKRTAGLIAITAGVVLAGTGGYLSSVARGAARDLEDRCTPGCDADDADIAALDADGKAAQRNATLLYGAGGVAVAAGAALLAWGVLDGRTSARHVALVPARSGAIAVAGWSF